MSEKCKTLWLVRHGDTVWSETGGIAGRSDIDLSEKGRARIVLLAGTLPDPIAASLPDLKACSMQHARWFASPLRRTRETTSLLRVTDVNGIRDGTVNFDERLVELDFGDWEGRSWMQVHEKQGGALAAWGENWVTTAPPNGESFEQQVRRCASWFNDWQAAIDPSSHFPDSAIVVTHGGCIRALLCLLLDLPLNQAMRWSVDLACVFRFTWSETDPHWRLRAANHLSF